MQIYQLVLGLKVSKLNILMLLPGYKNKGEYISSQHVGKYEGEVCINYQEVPEKPRWSGTAQVPNKIRRFLPEEKMVANAIKDMTRNRLKVSPRWINKNTMKDILNYFYSVDNDTWLWDKSRLLQS